MTERNTKWISKKVIPRLFKAAIWGVLTFVIIYYLPMMVYPMEILPIDYTTPLFHFAMIFVFFAVVGQLFSGTIIGCGFGVAKAIVIIAYFLAVTDGGIFSVTLPVSEFTVNLAVDISIILFMIISVNLLNIVKNLLSAIVILNEKSTNIDLR